MMIKSFDEKLKELNEYLTEMGSLVNDAINLTNEALVTQNMELASDAIQRDAEIDQMEREIEKMCISLMLLHNPVARDLRVVSAALKMITDLERIGDQCRDISEIVIIMADVIYAKKIEHIPAMADEVGKMVTNSITAYVNKDLELARRTRQDDDKVDSLFLTVKRELTDVARKNPDDIGQAIDLLMVAKYFERIGDHAENIAEWVEYMITGQHVKLELS